MFKFRKVASVVASAAMLTSTVALAAAANFPAPFVQNGQANVAVVWGSAGQNTDIVAATNIVNALNAALPAQTASTTSSNSTTTVVDGDFVQLERGSDLFNLGDSAGAFYSTLDEGELSVVLAEGTYLNDNKDDFDYDQSIALGTLTLGYQQDNDYNDEKPWVGFKIADGSHILNYTLDFSPDAATGGAGMNDFETTTLKFLGREYYISAAGNTTATNQEFTLLDTANTALISEGESSSVQVGDKTYEISIADIDSTSVILDIDGESTNALEEGQTEKLADGSYVAVKDIRYNSKDTGVSKVELSIGSGKIVLKNGQEVEINGDKISTNSDSIIKAYFTMSGNDLDKMVLEWNADDDIFIGPNTELVMPGFETVKLSMGNFVAPGEEKTTIANDGDDSIKLTTTVTDGPVSFNLLYSNATDFIGLGKSATGKLVTNTRSDILIDKDTDDWFVATWISGDDSESYVLKLDTVSSTDAAKNTTTFTSVATGSSRGVTMDVGESEDLGQIRFTLVKADESGKWANITAAAAGGSGSVYFNRLVTKDGLTMYLPVNTAATLTGAINLSDAGVGGAKSSWTMNFTEETKDGDIATTGKSFTATLGLTGGETTVSAVSVTDYETSDGSDNFEGYVVSDIATRTLLKTGGDQDTLDVYYPGDESYAEVYLSEAAASISGGNGNNTVERGVVLIQDNEIDSAAGKNLVVVGGSCINTVAQTLLGTAKACGSEFTAKTGVEAGQFLVQTFDRGNGKVATLVAGYNAVDTTNAATYLTTQTVDTTTGKKYVGTTATQANLVTA